MNDEWQVLPYLNSDDCFLSFCRYKTFVYAYNEVSNITSEKVEIMVYEAISMVNMIHYATWLW